MKTIVTDQPEMRSASTRELAAIAGLLLLVTLAQLVASGTQRLIYHPPWLDECLATVLLDDPSFGHSMTALSHGGNHSPPTTLILLRPLRWISGNIDIVELRMISALTGLLAGVAVFGIARFFCDRSSAFIAALALWAHPVFVEVLYEARFYSMWLAATAWLGFFLLRDSRTRSTRDLVLASVMAVLAATLHWYGAIALLLMGVADFLANRSMRRMIPFIVGAIALACCLPVLSAQRKALIVPTWIDPISPKQFRLVMVQLFAFIPLVLAAIGAWISRRSDARDFPGRAMLASLCLLPFALLLLSLAGQPAMVSRYALAVTIPLCAIIAWLASMSGRCIRIALLIFIVITGGFELHNRTNLTDNADALIQQSIHDVDEVITNKGPLPVIFLRRHEMYPLINLRPDLAASSALLNFDTGLGDWSSPTLRFEQQMARIDHEDYPQYQLVNYSQLEHGKHFFVIAPPQAGGDLRVIFPGAQIRPHGFQLFELQTP